MIIAFSIYPDYCFHNLPRDEFRSMLIKLGMAPNKAGGSGEKSKEAEVGNV